MRRAEVAEEAGGVPEDRGGEGGAGQGQVRGESVFALRSYGPLRPEIIDFDVFFHELTQA